MSDLNVQSPTTPDEKLWAAQELIKALEAKVADQLEKLLKVNAENAALKQQLEARND